MAGEDDPLNSEQATIEINAICINPNVHENEYGTLRFKQITEVLDKNRKYLTTDFAVPAHDTVKLKESEHLYKYHDLVIELKKRQLQSDSSSSRDRSPGNRHKEPSKEIGRSRNSKTRSC